MSSENLTTWLSVCRPPETALKKISGGRLKGMTDINPQWRYKAMTEQFGIVGFGWKYRVTERWEQRDSCGQVAVFVSVALQVKHQGEWSDDIHGSGGAMLIAEENKTDFETKERTKALYLSDEAYKMAETDALSVAMKQIGVAADIYMGMFDGSKYTRPAGDVVEVITEEQFRVINDALDETKSDKGAFITLFKLESLKEMKATDYDRAVAMLNKKRAQIEAANGQSKQRNHKPEC